MASGVIHDAVSICALSGPSLGCTLNTEHFQRACPSSMAGLEPGSLVRTTGHCSLPTCGQLSEEWGEIAGQRDGWTGNLAGSDFVSDNYSDPQSNNRSLSLNTWPLAHRKMNVFSKLKSKGDKSPVGNSEVDLATALLLTALFRRRPLQKSQMGSLSSTNAPTMRTRPLSELSIL
jgi:hypothetical protein